MNNAAISSVQKFRFISLIKVKKGPCITRMKNFFKQE